MPGAPHSILSAVAVAAFVVAPVSGTCPSGFIAGSSCTLPQGSVCNLAEFQPNCEELDIQGAIDVGNGFVDILASTVLIGGSIRGADIRISARANVTIQPAGVVTADGLGYYGTPDVVNGAGARRRRRVQHDYGSMTHPTTFGTGEGTSSSGFRGGGRILLEACARAVIDGQVRTRGTALWNGGSGGSILALASVIAGSGILTAPGSDDGYGGTCGGCGNDGGGGGRVAMHAQVFGNVQMSAPGGQSRGVAGTVHASTLDGPLQQLHHPRWNEATPDSRPGCPDGLDGAAAPGSCPAQSVAVLGTMVTVLYMAQSRSASASCPFSTGSLRFRCPADGSGVAVLDGGTGACTEAADSPPSGVPVCGDGMCSRSVENLATCRVDCLHDVLQPLVSGYNLYTGDPLATPDPGFSYNPIFNLSAQPGQSPDIFSLSGGFSFEVPDGITITKTSSFDGTVLSKESASAAHFRDELSSALAVTGVYGQVAFQASHSLQSRSSRMYDSSMVYWDAYQTRKYFTAAITTDAQLSDYFVDNVMLHHLKYGDVAPADAQRFIGNWGTHYFKRVTFGARVWRSYELSLQQRQEMQIDSQVAAASARAEFGKGVVEGGAEVGVGTDNSVGAGSRFSAVRTVLVGFGSPELMSSSAVDWADALPQHAQPIEFDIRAPISDLLRPAYFERAALTEAQLQSLTTFEAAVRTHITEFCERTSLCVSTSKITRDISLQACATLHASMDPGKFPSSGSYSPELACSSHGSCSFGACVCNSNFVGVLCEEYCLGGVCVSASARSLGFLGPTVAVATVLALAVS